MKDKTISIDVGGSGGWFLKSVIEIPDEILYISINNQLHRVGSAHPTRLISGG
jgi:hypothetical protein